MRMTSANSQNPLRRRRSLFIARVLAVSVRIGPVRCRTFGVRIWVSPVLDGEATAEGMIIVRWRAVAAVAGSSSRNSASVS